MLVHANRTSVPVLLIPHVNGGGRWQDTWKPRKIGKTKKTNKRKGERGELAVKKERKKEKRKKKRKKRKRTKSKKRRKRERGQKNRKGENLKNREGPKELPTGRGGGVGENTQQNWKKGTERKKKKPESQGIPKKALLQRVTAKRKRENRTRDGRHGL